MKLKNISLLFLLVTSICHQQSSQAMSLSFTKDLISNAAQLVNNNKLLIGAAVTIPAITYFAGKNYLEAHERMIHWDWQNIDETQIKGIPLAQFFKNHALALKEKGIDWLWGTGTSAHQVEGGCTNNQWYRFENKPLGDLENVVPAGIGCDHWNRYKEDIQLMKKIHTNTYRFSVEWSKVMPQPGVVDRQALQHYKDVCQELVKNGIKPTITLYHYTEPQWFYDLGGFEKVENIEHFVTFCKTVFAELHPYVHLWLTFNSPEGVAAQGWLTGTKPPAKKDKPLMARVLHHLLEAHVQVYRALKAMPGGAESKIGMLKNILQLDPTNPLNPMDQLGCKMGNDLVNDSVYKFFTTGTFHIHLPGIVNYKKENEYIKNGGTCLDFIGLNYYCHNYISFYRNGKFFKNYREENQEIEIHCNNLQYTIYGEGLYRAIQELSDNLAQPLGLAIYITENGIGTDNDEHRDLFHRRYLYALAKAIADGYNVCGYILWSLMDNYEWGQYSKHYGIYKVDRDNNLERSPKDGAKYYVDLMKESKIY